MPLFVFLVFAVTNNDEMNILCKCVCASACIYLEDKFLNQNDWVKVDAYLDFRIFNFSMCQFYHKF